MQDDLFVVDTSGTPCVTTTPQLGTDLQIELSDGWSFRLLPQRNITGYQAVLITKLLTMICSDHAGYGIDDLFYSVYQETAQHWIRVK